MLEKKQNPGSSMIAGIAIMVLATVLFYVGGWFIITLKVYADYEYFISDYALRFFAVAIAEIIPVILYCIWFKNASKLIKLGSPSGNTPQYLADFTNVNAPNGVYTKSNKRLFVIITSIPPVLTFAIILIVSNSFASYWLDGYTTPLYIIQFIVCVLQMIVNIVVYSAEATIPFKKVR